MIIKIGFIISFLFFSSLVNGQEKIILVTGEWAPYTSEKLENYGFFSEIVSAVFKEMDVQIEYRFYPWKRCANMVEKAQAFAAFPYRITEERKQKFDFSDKIASSKGVLFCLKSNFPKGLKWKTYKDLIGYKIGGTSGYWYEEVFKEAGLNVSYSSSDELNIKLLNRGKIELAATEELVAWALVRKLYPDKRNNFNVVGKPLNESDLHMMISKNYPRSIDIKEKFNNSLVKIKENGLYMKILEKYDIRK